MLDPLTLKALLLGGLAFHLVTLMLYVLARQHQIGVERHDLIRAARQRRKDYLQSIDDRREAINAMAQKRQANPLGVESHARGDYSDQPVGSVGPADTAQASEPALAKAA